MDTPTLTNDTVVVLKVQFSEPHGSTRPIKLVKTVQELGITLPDGEIHLPTPAEAKAAVDQDRDFPGSNALAILLAKYHAMNSAVGNPVVALRKALTDLIKSGALFDHKVDGENYQWQGDEGGLAAQWRTDDAAGSETGTPNLAFLNFSGAAVWGHDPDWLRDFSRIIANAGGTAPLNREMEDDWLNQTDGGEPEDEDTGAGNDDGVLTVKVPLGLRVLRIELV